MSTRELFRIKAQMLELGVAPEIIESVTKEDLALANDPVKVTIECWKCGRTHQTSKALRDRQLATYGQFNTKCGWCYL